MLTAAMAVFLTSVGAVLNQVCRSCASSSWPLAAGMAFGSKRRGIPLMRVSVPLRSMVRVSVRGSRHW